MFRPLIFAGALLLSPALLADSQPRFISGDIFVNLLQQPGNESPILDRLSDGTQVTFTGETSGEFAKVIDARGQQGWVLISALSSENSHTLKSDASPEATESDQGEPPSLQENFSNSDSTINGLKTQLARADELIRSASTEKLAAEAARDEALAQLASLQDDQKYRVWREGGLIAGTGMLLGFLLAYIPRPQRRRKNRWMN